MSDIDDYILYNSEEDDNNYENILHNTPLSPGIDNSPRVDNLATHMQILHVQTPPQQIQQQNLPPPVPNIANTGGPNRNFTNPNSPPERPQVSLDDIIIQKRREKTERRRTRRKENKKFINFYVTLTDEEYTLPEIVNKYNEYFNSNITIQGFSKLKDVKNKFFSYRKRVNKTRITYYRKS